MLLCLGCTALNRSSFRPHQPPAGGISAVLADLLPAHLDPTYLSIATTHLKITHFENFTRFSANGNVNCVNLGIIGGRPAPAAGGTSVHLSV